MKPGRLLSFGAKIAVIQEETPLCCAESNQAIVEEARRRGHEVEVINPGEVLLKMDSAGASLVANEREFKPDSFDVVIPRIDSEQDPYISYPALATLRQFETMGIPCLNSSESIEAANDKLKTHQLLVRHRVATTTTFFAKQLQQFIGLLKLIVEFVIKGVQGSKGEGVEKTDFANLMATFRKAWSQNNPVIVQPFESSAQGEDYRYYVVLGNDGKRHVVGGMQRKANEGEFRANASLGGTQGPLEHIDPQSEQLAVAAADALNLDVAGIDILHTDGGRKVLEANSTPGFKFYHATTGHNLAKDIINAAEAKMNQAPSVQTQTQSFSS